MSRDRLLELSGRWFRLLRHLYPTDFADDMGTAIAETYRDRARAALQQGRIDRLAALWVRAFIDAVWNGAVVERFRPAVAWRRSGNWGRDAELATRRLLRAPMLVIAVVGTLGLGLGLFAVVYSVVQKILIEPPPYKNPGDLYFVWRDYRAFFDLNRGWLAGPDVAELQKAGDPIEGASALFRRPVTFTPREGADATEISVIAASPNLFDLLGIQPMLGRGFASSEGGPKRPPVIVLTHDLWNRLGADRSMLGSVVRLNGEPYTVIGILPPAFTFVRNASLGPPERCDAFTTIDVNLADASPTAGAYGALIRARPGTPPQTVAAAVDAVARVVDARYFNRKGLRLYPVGLHSDLVAGVRPALLVLGFAGLLLVLVLMVNLATVLLARAAQREHEFAVSRALGADGRAIARATIFEGGLLGLAGGVVATIAAAWGTPALVALAPLDLPRRDAVAVDWRIAIVVIGLGTILGLVAAVTPAVWAARASLASLLANSAVRGGGGRGRMRRAMVVVQVALSLLLLTTGGLVVRSFERLLRADAGFDPEGLLTIRVPMPPQFVTKPEDVAALQERIEQSLRAIPGVTAVGAASALPLSAAANQTTISIPGAPGNTGNPERDAPLVDYIGTRAGYIEAMGIRVAEGRPFDRLRRDGVREAMIDRNLARQFFAGGGALGARIPWNDKKPDLTVVGIVDQPRMYDVHQDGRPQLYLRAEDFEYRNLVFVARTRRDPIALVPEARSAIRAIDPRLALSDVRTMDEVIGNAVRRQRVSAVLLSAFAVGALLLAALGLFGIVSGSVTRRRHELALRLALGADHRRVMGLVLAEGAFLVMAGVAIGTPGIHVAGRLLRGVLVGVSPFDPLTLGGVALGLGLVTMLACYLPARRVLRIDPAQSLRQE